MQNISVTSRVSLLVGKLTFDDLDGAMAGSRLRGRMSLTLDDERNVEGEIGLDALDLAPAFALAIGSRGRDAAEPLGAGLLKGWRGRIAFQALRGQLPDGGELRPFSGTVKSDGQSLTLDTLKGGIGGGEANATIDARQTRTESRSMRGVQLSDVDGAALALSRAGDAGGPRLAADDTGEPGPQRVGADGRDVRQRHRDAGIRRDRRSRSPRLRCRDPRQRRRAGDRRYKAARDRRSRAGRRRAPGRVGANSVHDPRRPASRQRRPRSIPMSRARSCPAATIFRPTRPIFARPLPRPRSGQRPAARKFRSSRPARPMRSIAPSMSRRCRHGWR